ncbi:MAG: hypothetical protein GF388_12010 [Candidatus Aegiribacteria sp.]|nr:hypothetical protein [Candidatus Aegiribacteria sp.]MBD3295690.1 hypothetical protein [Candidatus Fermentibacteria bacterium]
MKSCLSAALLILASFAPAAPSSVEFYSVSISMSGDTLQKTVRFRGTQGDDRVLSRIARGFDPEVQNVQIVRAAFGSSPDECRDVPDWAVDTLGSTGTWPRTLVVAFPALNPGMSVEYEVRISDWSENWRQGPWAVLSPRLKGIRPDTCQFTITFDDLDELNWSGRGYTVDEHGNTVTFLASDSAGTVAISPFGSYLGLMNFLLSDADSILSLPYPPDLREAALQATSAGALQKAQALRTRTLLCNSIAPSDDMTGNGLEHVRPIQDILDSRSANPLETAMVFTAICRSLGMEASILPASETRMPVPVPQQWDRFLVEIVTDQGDIFTLEPSSYLAEAQFVYRPDTLYVIRNGLIETMQPNTPSENLLFEEWTLDLETGLFRLELECSGWFDMNLRRRTAGLSDEEVVLRFAQWSWLSGRTLVPDSVVLSDPFRLDEPAWAQVLGSAWEKAGSGENCRLLPVLVWSVPSGVEVSVSRTWIIEGCTEASAADCLSVDIADEGIIIEYDGRISKPPLAVLKAGI